MEQLKKILSEEKDIQTIRTRLAEITDRPFDISSDNGSVFVKFEEKEEDLKENLQLLEERKK